MNGVVYFVCRNNTFYACRTSDGTLVWKKSLGSPLPYEWGFDYYIGSPAIDNGTLYIGSADGNLYALNSKDGRELWKFKSSSLIRSTPAIDERNIYFGDCSGKIFAVDKSNGTRVWQFSTVGDTLDNEKFGFDRKAVISSPTIYKDKIFVGGRDGFLYALDKASGKEIWKYDYQVSWIISTAAIKNDILITGTSDGRFFHALNAQNGKQLWRFTTNGPVWASPVITKNDRVVISSNDGYVYCVDLNSGIEHWRYKIGPQIFSSTVPLDNSIYFGSDDGFVYSLKTKEVKQKPLASMRRAVFWMKDPVIQSFRNGMDVYIRDYFIREGYEFYDETDVKNFLLTRIKSDTASAMVFATNYFLPSLTADTLGSNVIQAYMKSGGRIVVLGLNPAAYELDSAKKQVIAINFEKAKRITGIPYRYKDLRTHGGFYSSFITEEGRKWGLKSSFVGISGMSLDDITTSLAIDENGKATAWVKTFSEKKHSGFIQLYLTPDRLGELPEVQKVAEYGLR
ncbi:MAG: PQQ-binding-like beta-propeller repeat protein [Ignavibacteriales bacterium]|nr:PQQ-binding-like beta-propeller repeat protein [Ignavibacteriales bacterium]